MNSEEKECQFNICMMALIMVQLLEHLLSKILRDCTGLILNNVASYTEGVCFSSCWFVEKEPGWQRMTVWLKSNTNLNSIFLVAATWLG